MDADAIVVGAGLAGLVAAAELADAGRRVIILDQEGEASLGGQAFWSFGGLFFVDSPEQRRMRIRDSRDLAWQDWLGTAGFDRDEDFWPRRWAEAYVDFAAGEKRVVAAPAGPANLPRGRLGRARRLSCDRPRQYGAALPRHLGHRAGRARAVPAPRARGRAARARLVPLPPSRHVAHAGPPARSTACRATCSSPSNAERGQASSRALAGSFALRAQAIIVTSGGIGGNHELVRRYWPKRLGEPPRHMISGVPDHVDGLMLDVVRAGGGNIINSDRMWHYPEGIQNYAPIWSRHGIRILSGPSPLWLDATGRRLPAPLFPGFDSLGALAHITREGHDHSWFLLNERIIGREFALSGSEQNPDLTERSIRLVLGRIGKGAPEPVRRFMERGVDFVIRKTLPELVAGMNQLGGNLIDAAGSSARSWRATARSTTSSARTRR